MYTKGNQPTGKFRNAKKRVKEGGPLIKDLLTKDPINTQLEVRRGTNRVETSK